MPVSTIDYVSILDLLARYNWAVDEGDADTWSHLFTENGVFAGTHPVDTVGRNALRQIPLNSGSISGPMRHVVGNLHCDYGEDENTIVAKYYNCVSYWHQEGKFAVLALATAQLVRDGDSWLIRRSDNIVLPRN